MAETVWLDGSTSVQRRYLYAGPRVLEVREVTAVDEPLVKRNIWSPEGIDTILRSDELATSGLRSGDLVSFYFTTDNMGSPSAALITSGVDGSGNIVTEVAERYLYGPDGQLFSVGESCRRADIDCDGMVGASDLVLVRNAYSATPPENAREDICGNGTLVPDTVIDDYDLACVRDELGKPALALYLDDEAVSDPLAADLPKPKMRLGLHGLPVDEATGLVFARARYYHPTLGRWMSRDPKGYVDGGNLYEAFGSNNARYADPMGTGVIAQFFLGDYEYDGSDWDFLWHQGGIWVIGEGACQGAREGAVNVAIGTVRAGKEFGLQVADGSVAIADIAAIEFTHSTFGQYVGLGNYQGLSIPPLSQSGQSQTEARYSSDLTKVNQAMTVAHAAMEFYTLGTHNVVVQLERYRETGNHVELSQNLGAQGVFGIALGLLDRVAPTCNNLGRQNRIGLRPSTPNARSIQLSLGRSRLSSTVETLFEDALTIDAAEASGMMGAKRIANYTQRSRSHVFTHGHAANSPRIPGKSRFRPTEGGQKFTGEVLNHPNVRITHQANGRILYEVDDLGRTVGRNRQGNLTRGGAVVVEGPSPASWSTYAPDEVVTQFPR